ncbi:N2227-domain-containing protein [Cubamyces sp. BRFM 1775]|nr:N2227-domain-containing protein [Cubamyces sp. BRFM 1775]
MSGLQYLVGSDYILACLIPLVLLVLSLQILGNPRDMLEVIFGRSHATPGYFSVRRAAASYAQYAKLSARELATMRSSYGRMSWAHRRIGYELGYTKKLARLEDAISTNARVAEAIAALAREQFPDEIQPSSLLQPDFAGDLGRVRESLKHFVRDWSDEGRNERAKIFEPILEVLRAEQPSKREHMRVLVPGSGLGRLAWEISQLGYHTTANELSAFMNLAFRFLLSERYTDRPGQHVLQPYASWFSHQRTPDAIFRPTSFPDVVPRLNDHLVLAEQDFLSLRPPRNANADAAGEGQGPYYDFIVTLFFIDTALNAIETLQHIHALLRPGGKWINLGPLLWTGGGQASVELSLEEVLRLAEMVGFTIVGEGEGEGENKNGEDGDGEDGDGDRDGRERRRTIECEYTADKVAMMKWLYQAEFWVARRAS